MKLFRKKELFFLIGVFLIFLNTPSQYTGMYISLIFTLAYWVFVYSVFKITGTIALIRSWTQREKLFCIGIYILANIWILSILLKERYIYFWDFAGYWGVSIETSENLFKQPLQTIIQLYHSINEDEYNRIIPCIISFPLKMLGNSFPMYALIIYNMFISITYISIYACVDKISQIKKNNIYIIWIIMVMTPAFYLPVLLGYLDAFSMSCISLSYLIVSTFDFRKFNFRKSFLLAIALLGGVLGRRYFAFPVFGIAVMIIILYLYLIIKKRDKIETINIVKNGFVIIITVLFVLGIFFRQFLMNSLDSTIAKAYSAYQTGGILWNYLQLFNYYGFFIILFIIYSIYFLIKEKKFNECSLYIGSLFISSYMFYKVQSMGNHHYYITLVPIIILLCYSVLKINKKNQIVFFLLISIFILNFVQANMNDRINLLNTKLSFFSNQKMNPKIRHDLIELENIVSKLKKYEKEGKTSYVLASSTIINDDLLRKVYMPDTLLSLNTMYVSSHVDLRDGFPKDFLEADLVLVANPIQYHLNQDGQRVIGLLAEDFIEQKGIYKNYQFVEKYTLDNDVTVSLYEKIVEYSEDDLIYLKAKFNEFYFDYPDLFENRISIE